ncbi:MAG: phosphoenolpyruvate--protein phosphotransferase [candidate division KSB1 bacterium]|nr:phosphoenolpyruvate--protein phosphotransferase [candidate division KSB1 bacterium]
MRLRGLPVSPGIAIGSVFLVAQEVPQAGARRLSAAEVAAERDRFLRAVEAAQREIRDLREHLAKSLGEQGAAIFDMHELLLTDQAVVEATVRRIERDLLNAEHVFTEIMERHERTLEESRSELFQQRAADVRDVKRRVLRHLVGDRRTALTKLPEVGIVVARELTPSDTAAMDPKRVLGFATDLGGKTSHAAIMARALRIPAVVGLHCLTALAQPGDTIIVDGLSGEVVVRPRPSTLEQFRRRQQQYLRFTASLEKIRDLPCRTLDGKDVELSANIELPEELESLRHFGAYGIGLYRTEYLYLAKPGPPTEEELYQEFARVVKAMRPHSVIIRTLDIGGDKKPDWMPFPEEQNPFLGLRGVRLCFEREELFRTQLRAILRAGTHGAVKILFPMISSLTDFRRCKAFVDQAREELRREGKPFAEKVELGVMVEVPSAAIAADVLAREADFLSIGTNDLIQYTLAVDRGNEHIAEMYRSFDPAVLRLIKETIEKGHRSGVWVGMCGEMAGDPLATLLLLGLGLDEFSVSPVMLLEIKRMIRSVTFAEAEQVARWAMELATAQEVEEFLSEVVRRRFPDILM